MLVTILAVNLWALMNAQQYMATSTTEIPEVMHRIAVCESGDRQFDKNGKVIRGAINPKDVGKYQLNEKYHLKSSKDVGIDIYTEFGNEQYALYLYENEGTTPWNSSKSCWDN